MCVLSLQKDPFPGEKPIPKERIQKYKRGEKMETVSTLVDQIIPLFKILFLVLPILIEQWNAVID